MTPGTHLGKKGHGQGERSCITTLAENITYELFHTDQHCTELITQNLFTMYYFTFMLLLT